MKEPDSTTSAKSLAATAAERLAAKSRELASRASWLLVEEIRADGFHFAMVEESAAAVAFWVDELKKATRG